MKKYIAFIFLLLLIVIKALAQVESEPIKSYQTAMIVGDAPIMDGTLNDPAWSQVEWGGDFIAHRPEFKADVEHQTQFKILYDAKFLYVGIRAFDSEPNKIAQRMSRRDGFDGDWVEFNVDSYHDKRTAFSFTASVSGVKGDEYVTNNGDNWDSTWDPIWYLKTSIDEQGWIAEFKIPLSQLRFANQPEHTWGIQVTRLFFRNDKRSTWQPINPQANGWVHLFGELKGIKGIKPQKQFEIQPFVVGQLDKFPKVQDDPYRETGKDLLGNVGIDAKIGVTSDITLDLTINPDFGQVEADPSVVNLSAFEQYYRERRPFFLEGRNLFNFQTSGGSNNLFYSRRIGAPAHGNTIDEDIAYVDRIPNTRILSAAKLTGKNAKGFSWGVLTSVTGQVMVDVTDTIGNQRKEKIEPYTMYSSARVQQDINDGQTVVGAIVNHMQRFDNVGNDLEDLHDNAQSFGVDLTHNILDRKYGFKFQFSGSKVAGSRQALTNTQESNVRNFQRPDNDYQSVDTTRKSLMGTSSRIQFGKKSGNWVWEMGANHRSPGFELNDMGFLSSTDNINIWAWSQYRILKEKKVFRSQRYNLNIERNYDFGLNPLYQSYNANVELQFKNLWYLESWISAETLSVSNADLRGGPSIKNPGGVEWGIWASTNEQKKVRVYASSNYYFGQYDAYYAQNYQLGLTIRPLNALYLSLEPNVILKRSDIQYVNTLEIEGNSHYLLATINQETYSMAIRANYNITPNLTIELWGQPFLATGSYDQYKLVDSPRDNDYHRRFIMLDDKIRKPNELERQAYATLNDDKDIVEDENALGFFKNSPTVMDAYFDDPDFNFIQFRSNCVLRWEYIPGSTLFLVWSNNSSHDDQTDKNRFKDLYAQVWNLEQNNIFLFKYTYRFLL